MTAPPAPVAQEDESLLFEDLTQMCNDLTPAAVPSATTTTTSINTKSATSTFSVIRNNTNMNTSNNINNNNNRFQPPLIHNMKQSHPTANTASNPTPVAPPHTSLPLPPNFSMASNPRRFTPSQHPQQQQQQQYTQQQQQKRAATTNASSTIATQSIGVRQQQTPTTASKAIPIGNNHHNQQQRAPSAPPSSSAARQLHQQLQQQQVQVQPNRSTSKNLNHNPQHYLPQMQQHQVGAPILAPPPIPRNGGGIPPTQKQQLQHLHHHQSQQSNYQQQSVPRDLNLQQQQQALVLNSNKRNMFAAPSSRQKQSSQQQQLQQLQPSSEQMKSSMIQLMSIYETESKHGQESYDKLKNAHVNAKSFINGMRNLVRVLVNGVNGGGGMMDELVLVMVPGEQQEGGEGSTSVGDVAASVARNAARIDQTKKQVKNLHDMLLKLTRLVGEIGKERDAAHLRLSSNIEELGKERADRLLLVEKTTAADTNYRRDIMALQEKLEQKMEEMNTRIKTEAESHQQTQRRLDSEVGNHTDTKALLTASLAETASLRESLQTSQQRQIDQTLEHNKLMAKNIEDAAADKLAATTLLSYTHSEAMAAASNDWQMERVKMNKQAEWLAGNNLRQLKLLEDDNQQLKAELRGICLKLVYLMVRNREEVVKKRSLLSHLSRMHGNAIYSTQHDYLLKLQDVRESCNQQLETAVRNAHEEELEAASQRIHTALKEASEAAALILSQLNDKHTAVVDGLKQDLEGVRGEVVSAREKLKLVGDKFEQSQHEYKQVVAQLTAARLAKDDLLIEKDVLVEQVKEIKRECEGMALQLGRADLDKQALEGCVQDLEEMRDNLISRAESLMREHAVGLDRVKAEAAEAAIHHHLKSSSVIGQLQTELKAAVDKFDKMTKTHASTMSSREEKKDCNLLALQNQLESMTSELKVKDGEYMRIYKINGELEREKKQIRLECDEARRLNAEFIEKLQDTEMKLKNSVASKTPAATPLRRNNGNTNTPNYTSATPKMTQLANEAQSADRKFIGSLPLSAVIDATTIGQDQQHEAHIRPSSVSRKRFNVVANDASITTAPSTPATVAPVNSKVKFASIKKRTGAGLHSNKKAAIAMIKNPTALKNSNKLEDIDDDDEEVNEEDDEASGGQELEKIGGAGYAKERASSKRNRKSSDAGRRIADPIEDEDMNHSNQNNKVRKVSSRPVNINRAPPVVASVAAMTTAAVVSKKKSDKIPNKRLSASTTAKRASSTGIHIKKRTLLDIDLEEEIVDEKEFDYLFNL